MFLLSILKSLMMKKKIVLGNAAINNGNRGCVALSYTSIYLIDKILSEHGIDYELFLTDSGIKGNTGLALQAVDIFGKRITYIPITYLFGIGWKTNVKGLFCLLRSPRNLYNLITADCILDIGQGDSFADIYGKRRFNLIDRLHKVARLFSKPYCLLPQTVGPFNDPRLKAKAHKSIMKARMVMTRDKMSYDYLKQNVPSQNKIGEYIDVAFFLPYKRKSFVKDKTHVGINVSALLWHGGYTRDNQFGLKEDYQKVVRTIIDYFLQLQGVQIHLVPHVVGGERHVENDYAVSYDLLEEYDNPSITLAPLFLDPVAAKSYIAGLDFFVGARMHATIAAFSSGVPVIPMAYSRKFNGLFTETLSYGNLVDLKKHDISESLSVIKKGFEGRGKLKAKIDMEMATTVKKKETMLLNDLSEILCSVKSEYKHK